MCLDITLNRYLFFKRFRWLSILIILTLEKFESLIFSGLISNPDKLTSSFDGMDQVGNLMKAMKGKD